MTKEEGLAKVKGLCLQFTADFDKVMATSYSEEDVKQHYVTPFFEALGWDTKQLRYVKMEKRAKTTYSKTGYGRIDYIFRLNERQHAFYVEAKKPFVKVDITEPVIQAKSYSYSNPSTPLAVLSNFKSLQIWYVTKNPVSKKYINNLDHDKVLPKKGELGYLEYEKYWDTIWNLLSFEAHSSRSYLDHIKEGLKKAAEDKESLNLSFVNFLLEKRIILIKHLKVRNPLLSDNELEEVAQRLIDRILFIQNAEDRAIFDNQVNGYEPLLALADRENSYNEFLSRIYDKTPQYLELFNGAIFKKHALSDSVTVDDKLFNSFIKGFYPPESPYRFDVIESEILGQVYELFLGSRVRVTEQRATVEQSKEARSKGGVFYTPSYIVEYLVEDTVAKIFEGKKIKDVEHVKIIDPSCGSGSFLLGVYDYLCRWYAKSYEDDPKQGVLDGNRGDYMVKGGLTFLTMKKRGNILQRHIYGIDIDKQAVEIAMFSLYIKTMDIEEEMKGELPFIEDKSIKALPTLDNNIKCGNALLGYDDYSRALPALAEMADFNDLIALKLLNYREAFPEVMASGGFDVVLGNPPYLRVQGITEHWGDTIKKLYSATYQSAQSGNYDLANLFIEKGLSIIKPDGYFAYIVSSKFLNADNAVALRSLMLQKEALESIIHFGVNKVFSGADTYTCLFVARGCKQDALNFYRMANNSSLFKAIQQKQQLAKVARAQLRQQRVSHSYSTLATLQRVYGNNQWLLFNSLAEQQLFTKLYNQPRRVADVFSKIYQGLATSGDDFMIGQLLAESELHYTVSFKQDGKEFTVEKRFFKKMVMGKEVHRYQTLKAQRVVFFPYDMANGKALIASQPTLKKETPLTWAYVDHYRALFKGRERSSFKSHEFWYEMGRAQALTLPAQPKLMSMNISTGQMNVTYDESGLYHNTKVYGLIKHEHITEDYLYWVALLNSPLCFWFMFWTGDALSGEARTIATAYLNPFPLPPPPSDVVHSRLVNTVKQLISFKERYTTMNSDYEKSNCQNVMASIEKDINQQVYSLYGLTPQEQQIVENVTKQG